VHVTVAICTWNRAKLLDQTLVQMRSLQVPDGVSWELLVVNNNCTDATDAVIAKHTGVLPLRRLLETNLGLSNARNRVIAVANGEMILWTDDDVLVDPGWMVAYLDAAAKWPDASFFGGPIFPWFEVPPPAWAAERLDKLSSAFVIRASECESKSIGHENVPWGANMAFRRSCLREIVFDPHFGRKGTGMLGGEEAMVFHGLLKQGKIGRWVGEAKLRHFVEAERCTPKYVYRSFQGLSETAALMRKLKNPHVRSPLPRWALRMWLEASWRRLRHSKSQNEEWFEALRLAASMHGTLVGWRKSQKIKDYIPQP
jgi:glucosyl-dolichyl phosphate glucuronosyltransferase